MATLTIKCLMIMIITFLIGRVDSYGTQESCIPGQKRAPTYCKARDRYPDNSHFWCRDETESKKTCAPSAVLHDCPSYRHRCKKAKFDPYTKISNSICGQPCITNCDSSEMCWISYLKKESCIPGQKRAPTYYTARDRYPDSSVCLSKCIFGGKSYSWCYIDDDWNWDYCSTKTNSIGVWHQATVKNALCKDECKQRDGTSYDWCHTFWTYIDAWDYCNKDFYYNDTSQSIQGKECNSICARHYNSHFWCWDEIQSKMTCAPSAVLHDCPSYRHRPQKQEIINDNNNTNNLTRTRRSPPPGKTVSDYNDEIDREVINNNAIRVELSTLARPDPNNPILDYTYRVVNNVRLPIRIRARITSSHRRTGPRGSDDISPEARKNCKLMDKNRCLSNGNNNACGHMIPWILGGPPDWYNIVPLTRRLNVGTVWNTDVNSPSVWAQSEREMRYRVEAGGYVDFTVVIMYDPQCLRPTGFGIIEHYRGGTGQVDYDCSGYWYSNDPFEDPDKGNK